MPDSQRFEALLATKRSISAAGTDLESVFDVIVHQGLSVIPEADGAVVQMRDAGDLVYRAASGAAERLVGRHVGIGRSIAGRSVLSGMPLICPDVEQEDRIDLSPYRDAEMRALMAVPLIQHGLPIGALKFYARTPAAFGRRDLTAAELVAGHLVSGLAAVADETAVRASQQNAMRLEAITETVPQSIWAMTSDGETTYLNQRMLAALGADQAQAIGSSLMSIVDPRCRRHVRDQWHRALTGQTAVTFECRVRMPGGHSRWTLVHLSPVPTPVPDRTREWIGAATDIDGHKTTEIDLQDAVRTRELMLHETNHRVKNSLQIAAGLLALHASRITHPEAKARIMEARAQVRTIAQVHQAISLVNRQNRIELVGLLRDLATSLVGRATQRRAELIFTAPDTLLLSVEQGVPVALVTGEIITNAVKHATAQPDPVISVTVSHKDGHHIVEVADNGPGLPPAEDLQRSTGLGMEIIFGLAQQTGGSIEIDRSAAGARVRLIVPARA